MLLKISLGNTSALRHGMQQHKGEMGERWEGSKQLKTAQSQKNTTRRMKSIEAGNTVKDVDLVFQSNSFLFLSPLLYAVAAAAHLQWSRVSSHCEQAD